MPFKTLAGLVKLEASALETDAVSDDGPETKNEAQQSARNAPPFNNRSESGLSPSTETGPEDPATPSWRIRRMLGRPWTILSDEYRGSALSAASPESEPEPSDPAYCVPWICGTSHVGPVT